MENHSPFYMTKLMDVGTSHPVIARISWGISDLLDHSGLTKEKKSDLSVVCYNIAKDLIEAEKQAAPVIEEIEKIEKNLEKTNPKTVPSSIESLIHIKNVRPFLKFGKNALEKLANALGIIFDEHFPKPKFDEIITILKKKLVHLSEEEPSILQILKHYEPFVSKLIKYRNKDEHSGDPRKVQCLEPFLLNYKIEKYKDHLRLRRPSFRDGTPILEYLKKSQLLLLHFIEETLVTAISINFNPLLIICEISEPDRDPKFPKRFRLDIL